MIAKKLAQPPTFQELLHELQSSSAYNGLFPEMYILIDIILTLPVGTATVERSFNQMKLIKKSALT